MLKPQEFSVTSFKIFAREGTILHVATVEKRVIYEVYSLNPKVGETPPRRERIYWCEIVTNVEKEEDLFMAKTKIKDLGKSAFTRPQLLIHRTCSPHKYLTRQ